MVMNLSFLFMQVDLDADEDGEDPDVVDDAERGAQTIVIHPGSLHLRIGRACDSLPVTLPHCIAWRSRNSGYSNVVPWLSRPETEVKTHCFDISLFSGLLTTS